MRNQSELDTAGLEREYFLFPFVGMVWGGFVQILEQKGSHIICGLRMIGGIKKILFKIRTQRQMQDWVSFNLQALKMVKNGVFFASQWRFRSI